MGSQILNDFCDYFYMINTTNDKNFVAERLEANRQKIQKQAEQGFYLLLDNTLPRGFRWAKMGKMSQLLGCLWWKCSIEEKCVTRSQEQFTILKRTFSHIQRPLSHFSAVISSPSNSVLFYPTTEPNIATNTNLIGDLAPPLLNELLADYPALAFVDKRLHSAAINQAAQDRLIKNAVNQIVDALDQFKDDGNKEKIENMQAHVKKLAQQCTANLELISTQRMEYFCFKFFCQLENDVKQLSSEILFNDLNKNQHFFEVIFTLMLPDMRPETCESSARIFVYLHPELRENREFILKAVKKNGLILAYASDHLKNNNEIRHAALHNNGQALKFIPGYPKISKKHVLYRMAEKSPRGLGEALIHIHGWQNYLWSLSSDALLEAVKKNYLVYQRICSLDSWEEPVLNSWQYDPLFILSVAQQNIYIVPTDVYRVHADIILTLLLKTNRPEREEKYLIHCLNTVPQWSGRELRRIQERRMEKRMEEWKDRKSLIKAQPQLWDKLLDSPDFHAKDEIPLSYRINRAFCKLKKYQQSVFS